MKNLTEGNIYKNFIVFAIPMVLSGMFSQLYTTVDTVIVGRYLGSDGLAALGATTDLLTFLCSIFWGYSGGASIYAAKLFGAGEYKKLKNIVYNNVMLNVSAAVVVAVVVTVFCDPILDVLKVDTAIRAQAKTYMLVYVWGIGLITLHTVFVHTMQALGSGNFQFFMSLISAVLNVAGNIFTITVLHWGVAGVVLSTVFSAFVVDICFAVKLKQCFKELGVNKHPFHLDVKSIREPFVIGGINMLQQMVLYLSALLISPMINGIGSSATAGYVIAKKVYSINTGIYQNSAKTVSNYTAQCVGAGKTRKIKKGLYVGWMQGMLLFVPVLLLCVIFAKPVCGLFLSESGDMAAFDYAMLFVRFFLPFVVVDMLNNLFHAFFRGTSSMKLLFMSSFTGAVAQLVLTYLLRGYGMPGVYLAWILGWLTEAIFAVSAYLAGWWKKYCGYKD
ncbi:MAG: MATE family efflux transporter [Clostridia bacterium]|nr:MATE family efflux transporter [Clostridia bacterium]